MRGRQPSCSHLWKTWWWECWQGWAWVSSLSHRQRNVVTANLSIAQRADIYLAVLCKVSCSKRGGDRGRTFLKKCRKNQIRMHKSWNHMLSADQLHLRLAFVPLFFLISMLLLLPNRRASLSLLVDWLCAIFHLQYWVCVTVSSPSPTTTDVWNYFFPLDYVRRTGGKILVHCEAGISRSPTICMAYLMKTKKLCLEEAFDYIKQRRSLISPNFGFMGQLLQYESEILSSTPSPPVTSCKREAASFFAEELTLGKNFEGSCFAFPTSVLSSVPIHSPVHQLKLSPMTASSSCWTSQEDQSWWGPLIQTVTPTRTFHERAIEKPHQLSLRWSGGCGSYFPYAVTVRCQCSKCGRFSEF